MSTGTGTGTGQRDAAIRHLTVVFARLSACRDAQGGKDVNQRLCLNASTICMREAFQAG